MRRADLDLPQKPCYGEEAADDPDRHADDDDDEQYEERVHRVAGERHERQGVARPVNEQEVDPYHGQRSQAGPDQALHQPLEDERRPHEAVRGADELHNLDLLAPGKDGEPDGVRDQEHAGYQEEERGPVEPPDHGRGDVVEALYGLLRVAEVLAREP